MTIYASHHNTLLLLFTKNQSDLAVLESVYPGEPQPMIERFFLCYGDETPGSVEPLANTIPALEEVHRNGLHRETEYYGLELAGHFPF